VNGPGTLPSGTTGQYQLGGVADGAAIQWSLFGSGTLVGPTNGSDVVVIAGTPGLMTLKAAVTVAAVTDTCSRRIEVTPGSCAVLGPDIVLAGAPGITYTAATDATGGRYSWNVVGAATFTEGGDDAPTIVLAAGRRRLPFPSRSPATGGHVRPAGFDHFRGAYPGERPGETAPESGARPAGACGRQAPAARVLNGALFPAHYFAFLMVAGRCHRQGGLQCGIRCKDTRARASGSSVGYATSQAPRQVAGPGRNRISWDVTRCQQAAAPPRAWPPRPATSTWPPTRPTG
jgi:hypothetical protein